MKIRKLKSKQILSLYLLKSKTYEQVIAKNSSNVLVKECLTEILVSFKKALQIIFQYNAKNKLILFIGLPDNLRHKINKLTSHKALPKQSNLQNVISNGFQLDEGNKNLKEMIGNFQNKKPALIVINDHNDMESIVKESFLAKVPVIYINTNYDKKSFFYNNVYKVPISQNLFQPLCNFFFLGLSFLFKESR